MRYLVCFLLLCGAIAAYGQSAQQLTEEGMKLADAGDYKSAVAKYDAALKSDPAWLSAKSEKAVALYFLGKYQEAADLCKQALAQHKGSKELKAVYITYGNCLDELGQPKNALKVYKEGMKKFPDSYLLPFNSGLTYISLKAYDDAQEMLQKAILINPEHAGSHYYLGMTMEAMGKKIPATLALLRFLLLEHEGSKSDKALPYVLKKIKGNAARSTDGTINITIDESSMDKDKKDNFSTVDLLLSLSAAYDFDEKNKDKSELELFVQKFDVMVTAMDEQKKEGKGFFWEYYVPFFTDMKKQGHLETFCYVLYGYREGTNEEVEQWMAANQNRLQSFVLWAGAYPWPKELK